MLRRGPGVATHYGERKARSIIRQSFALGRSPRFGAVTALAALTLLVPSSVAQTPVSEGDTAGRTEVFIGLRELNDSGNVGVARLGVGDDENQTEVSVRLVEPDSMR